MSPLVSMAVVRPNSDSGSANSRIRACFRLLVVYHVSWLPVEKAVHFEGGGDPYGGTDSPQ